MDFIYFAQVVNADTLNEEMGALFQKRVLANRKTSAQLTAAVLDLPCWYSCYLKYKNLNPQKAAKHLIGFSNTTDYGQSHKLEVTIRRRLGLPLET